MRRGQPAGFVTVDMAGAGMGGAARYAAELRAYLDRSARSDVRVIGGSQPVGASWLARREVRRPGARRRVALNNVTFLAPGSERWTLLRNALHFLSDAEAGTLGPALRGQVRRDAAVVRLTARRADRIVVPCSAMAERVAAALPGVADRVTVRPHPVSVPAPRPAPGAAVAAAPGPVILCPVLLASYKRMDEHLAGLLAAVRRHGDPAVRVTVTAAAEELPGLAGHPAVDLAGRLAQAQMHAQWDRCRAVYFPTGLESFGYPLAEARARGLPVIARDTPQNREIAGLALCGYRPGDVRSLAAAVTDALTAAVLPDPGPFDPDRYFGWLLGPA